MFKEDRSGSRIHHRCLARSQLRLSTCLLTWSAPPNGRVCRRQGRAWNAYSSWT